MCKARSAVHLTLVVIGIVALSVTPGCRRAPEEPPPSTPAAVVEPETEPLTTIDLPQSNSEIGVTLKAAPEGLVATYNGEHWIELTDSRRPQLRYTFVSDPTFASGLNATSVDEFESATRAYSGGRFLDSGDTSTPLGTGQWAHGSYSEDGESIDRLMMWVPHPSGSGQLVITSTCPTGAATVQERLSVIKQLLESVS